MMHGPAGIRVLAYLPVTRWLAWIASVLRLTPLATAVNRVLSRIRKPLGRFFPDPRLPRRWPYAQAPHEHRVGAPSQSPGSSTPLHVEPWGSQPRLLSRLGVKRSLDQGASENECADGGSQDQDRKRRRCPGGGEEDVRGRQYSEAGRDPLRVVSAP